MKLLKGEESSPARPEEVIKTKPVEVRLEKIQWRPEVVDPKVTERLVVWISMLRLCYQSWQITNVCRIYISIKTLFGAIQL